MKTFKKSTSFYQYYGVKFRQSLLGERYERLKRAKEHEEKHKKPRDIEWLWESLTRVRLLMKINLVKLLTNLRSEDFLTWFFKN